MQSPNIEFIKSTLIKFVNANFESNDIEKAHFQIKFDPEEMQEPKTNMDEIKFYWLIPKYVGKNLEIETISDLLVTGHNEIPLWIKVAKCDNYFLLIISKRFRKMNVIKEFHKGNEFYPFLKF